MANDPYSLFHAALSTLFKESPALQNAVPNLHKNWRDFLNNRADVRPDVVNESDLPDLVQIASGASKQLSFASNIVQVTRTYELQINSGDWDISKVYYPLEFAVLATLVEANFGQSLRDLTWEGDKFVLDVAVDSLAVGISDQSNNRGISGWTSTWQISAQMVLSRTKLLEHYAGA